MYVLQYYFHKRFSQSYKMPFSLDCVDSLPDLSELLREMFNPVDADQYCEDAALEELEEFGEDVLYDGELFAEVVGVQKVLLDDMLKFSEYYELNSDDCNHIRVCQLRYLSAVLRASGDC